MTTSTAPRPVRTTDQVRTGRVGDRIFGGAATGAGLLVVALVALVGIFLVIQAVPALLSNEANFLTSRVWNPGGSHPEFGIVDLLWATVVTSIIALAVAVPLGVAVALFITQYSPTWLARPAADAGISGKSTLFFAGLILAVMVLPIITAISREVFAQVPAAHKEGALALGATHWEMIRTAVLPFGKPGVISASMLGLGRALGETLAVMILLSGLNDGSPWNWSIFNGGATFASKIALNAAEFDTPTKTGAYISAGLVLFILTFLVNAAARIVIERRKAFTE